MNKLVFYFQLSVTNDCAAQPGCYLGHPFSNFLLVPEKKPVNAAPLQVATHTPEGYAIEFIGPQCAKCGEPIVGRVRREAIVIAV